MSKDMVIAYEDKVKVCPHILSSINLAKILSEEDSEIAMVFATCVNPLIERFVDSVDRQELECINRCLESLVTQFETFLSDE